jgi:xylan 1,4-beta-xylosidase
MANPINHPLFMKFHTILLACGLLLVRASSEEAFPVTITVDVAKPIGELKPIWRFFGADEPNYAYMKDGSKLLGELGALAPKQVYFRAHHLLTSGDGAYALKFGSTSAYKEDAEGNAVYDWTINDRIFDAYLAKGVKPFVEIGFMPEALSTHPENYPRNPHRDKMVNTKAGQAYPPQDYVKWGELCYQWAKHCVERYGREEVATWYWEVWNEGNSGYWQGTREDFFRLHDYAIHGVRRALPEARVGGPHAAEGPGGTFLGEFLEHCARGKNHATGEIGTPVDFIAFHAKGKPMMVDGHVRMDMSHQLKNIDDAFAIIASFPEYRRTPIVIGECDPEGCAACRRPEDGYRNGTMYSSYTAASFPRVMELADKRGVNLEGALTWAFTFEDQPLFAGFRQLASGGIDLPVLNVFRMFSKMGGKRLAVTSSAGHDAGTILAHNVREHADVSAQASLDGKKLSILTWHYHDDDIAGPDADVELNVVGLPADAGDLRVTRHSIDLENSNAYIAWQAMGSPAKPTEEQFAELEQVSRLTVITPPVLVRSSATAGALKLRLPRQAVSLIVIE